MTGGGNVLGGNVLGGKCPRGKCPGGGMSGGGECPGGGEVLTPLVCVGPCMYACKYPGVWTCCH